MMQNYMFICRNSLGIQVTLMLLGWTLLLGKALEECKQEVDLSIQRLFYWGAYADKYGGVVQVSHYLVP